MERQSRTWFLALVLSGPGLLSGCRAQQIAHDGKNFRQAILDMYTDQCIDNLIRARRNMPFVQLAYSDISIIQRDDVNGTIGRNEMSGRSRTFTLVSGVTALGRTLNGTFMMGGGASRSGTMSFQADPVVYDEDLYECYRKFASNTAWLVSSDEKPDHPVHIMKKVEGRYYWVPIEAGPAFLDLAVYTMAVPDAATAAAFGSYGVAALNLNAERTNDILNRIQINQLSRP